MNKVFRFLFPFKKGKRLDFLFLLCIVIGLIVQIAVIACSFSWSEGEFGLPNVAPFIYIVFTFFGLSPYGGYVILALNLLLFATTFNGPNILNHPTFYHIAGMALYHAGSILSNIPRKKKTDAKQNATESGYNNRFQFKITHEEASDIASGMTRTTWKSLSRSFMWEIARPDTGTRDFSIVCPYCGKTLELVGVLSINAIASQKKSSLKAIKVSAVALTAFVLGSVSLFMLAHPLWMDYVIVLFLFGAMISLLVLLSSSTTLLEIKSPDFGLGTTKGELQGKRLTGPYNQHYIESFSGSKG